MGKVNRKGRSKTEPFFITHHNLMRGEAFSCLRATSQALFFQLCYLFDGKNNGELFLSQREAAKRLNLKNHATVARYFRELEEYGFIRVATKGSFDNKTKLATKWILTHHPYRDKPATRDYLKVSKRIREERSVAETRGGKSNQPGAIIVPDLPIGWPDGGSFCTHFDDAVSSDGDDNCTTYNIPQGVVTGSASNGVSNALN